MYEINLITLKILYGLTVFTIDFLCCSLLIWLSKLFIQPRNYSIITCFSAGVLISAAFIQLLGEAEKNPSIDTDGPATGFPLVHFLCAIGFIVTMVVQQLMIAIGSKIQQKKMEKRVISLDDSLSYTLMKDRDPDSQNNEDEETIERRKNMKMVAILFVLVAVTEGFLSGMTLGLQTSKSNVTTMFLAIVSHDWIESLITMFNLINTMDQATARKRSSKLKLMALNMLLSSINLIGICAGLVVYYKVDKLLLDKLASGSIALTSGCFFYIATVEMISKQLPDTAHFMGFKFELVTEMDDTESVNRSKSSKAKTILIKLASTLAGFTVSASVCYVFSRM
jgi:zinc transporter ZupT